MSLVDDAMRVAQIRRACKLPEGTADKRATAGMLAMLVAGQLVIVVLMAATSMLDLQLQGRIMRLFERREKKAK